MKLYKVYRPDVFPAVGYYGSTEYEWKHRSYRKLRNIGFGWLEISEDVTYAAL